MTTTRPPQRRPSTATRPAAQAAEQQGPRTVVVAVRRLFAAETPEYFLLLGTTLFLLAFGLIMVLSSSSIESRAEGGGFFDKAGRQGLYALVGIPAMLLAARAPAAFWRRWAGTAVVIGVALQLLVFLPGLGYSRGQNRNWINLGSFTAQPSELIKLALVLWLAWVLSRKGEALHEWREVALPILPITIVTVGLVLAGNDLGTATIILAIVFGALFYAGVRLRILAAAGAGVALVALMAVQLSDSRSNRIAAWLGQCSDPDLYSTDCWQSIHGWEALAHGGVFGVGLGNSSGKWSWIPEAANDFIFAIIGEELGMIGCVLVLLLFVVLAICFVRIIRMNRDPFAKLVVSAAMVWIIGQAFVNIAVVLGLLPVLGVPLPLVSAGGSALITTLAAIGIVLSFARHRPAGVPQR
ncbi:MAG TPA: putative lipid II flippase FtsW [Pseudolysinimonas sp.]|nr:putative lipid II flippase FtsW [Pseudolysinimonas sp.]